MTAKAIIDIEIGADQMAAFVAHFQEYTEALKATSSEWVKDAAVAKGMGGDFAQWTAALLAQAEIFNRQRTAKEEERAKERDARKEMSDARKAEERAERDRAAVSKRQIADLKEMGATVLGITTHLVKWAALGGLFTGLVGAGGLFGLDRLAGAVGAERRSALGLGTSYGEQQAFGLNFQRYVDTGANLENIANAKSDYSKRWAFSAMGVDPNADPAQLAVEMAQRARDLYLHSDKSLQFAQAHGLLEFYSMDELRRLGNTPAGELEGSTKDYENDKKNLELQEQTQQAWQGMSVQLHRAGLNIENAFVLGLKPLVPQLVKLSEAVAGAITKIMADPHFMETVESIGEGIKNFATFLLSAQFQADMKATADGLAAMAHGVIEALKWLGLIPKGPGGADAGGPAPPPAMSPASAMVQSIGALATGHMGRLKSSQFSAYGQAVGFYMSQGWTEGQAAGIVANLVAESGLDPLAVNPSSGMVGIGQWDKKRRAELAKFAGVKDWKQTTYQQQLAFVQHELAGSEKGAAAELRTQDNAFGAGGSVSLNYESPGNATWEATMRGGMASSLQNQLDKRDFGDMRALAKRLRDLRSVSGAQTLRALLQDLEGPKVNISAELAAISGETKIGADTKVDVANSGTMGALVAALEKRKGGGSYGASVVITILNPAGANVQTSTAQLAR